MDLQARTSGSRVYNIHRAIKENIKQMTLPRYFGVAEEVLQTLVMLVVRAEGDLSLENVCDHLEVRPRDLMRELRNNGLLYESIVLDVRRHFGVKLVMEMRSSADIARVLDYPDAGAFDETFSGWMGISPKQFREFFGGGS